MVRLIFFCLGSEQLRYWVVRELFELLCKRVVKQHPVQEIQSLVLMVLSLKALGFLAICMRQLLLKLYLTNTPVGIINYLQIIFSIQSQCFGIILLIFVVHEQKKLNINIFQMEQIQSYDLVLLIKELKLSVKFPCRLTLQHGGRAVSPEVQSNGSNLFSVNRDISIKEDQKKDYLEINVNLATDKGGNIMAGIIKINLRDIGSAEGENMTISLQKCLDPYATCLLTVTSVKIHRSRVKKGKPGDQWKMKESKFQSRSEAPVFDVRGFKSRVRFNEGQSVVGPKRVSINTYNPPIINNTKEKAMSTVGYRHVNSSFDREQLASRFKHFGRKQNDQSKTVIPGKFRGEVDQSFRASIEASQKTLKLEILKYKTKYEQNQRTIEEKNKQAKDLKDQISDLNRQLTQKHFLIEELNSKNAHISKLEETNKHLSKQIHEQRNKIIDIERQLEEEKNTNFSQISRVKQEIDKKDHELQKSIYEKREEIKQIMEEKSYKVNQINKMKGIIEDLQASLQSKTYQFEKHLSHQKTQHNKTKVLLQQKINQLLHDIKKWEQKDQEIVQMLLKSEEQNKKINNKLMIMENTILDQENKLREQILSKQRALEDKKRLERVEQQLNSKYKNHLKDHAGKLKDIQELNHQLSQLSSSSKKKINEFIDKNKSYTSRIQELENRINVLTAQEEKLKRTLDITQKEVKSAQDNQKIISNNSKLKDDKILQMERELTELQSKNNMKDSLSKKDFEYKTIQLQKMTHRVSELEKSYQRQKQTAEDRRAELLKNDNKVRMLEEGTSRLNEQIRQLKINHIKKEDDWAEKVKELKEELKASQAKESEYNKELHSAEIDKITLKNEISKLEKQVDSYSDRCDRLNKKQLQLEAMVKGLSAQNDSRNQQIVELEASYKIIENDFKLLQADKSKSDKITTIIKEEKGMAFSDINKLKKDIQKKEQREEQFQEQIKKLKQDIIKWQLKWNSTSKDFEKFKSGITDTIKSSLSVKTTHSSMDNLMASPTSLDHSRFMGRSRMKPALDYTINSDASESRFSEIIESYAKQSQQTTMILSDDLRKLKKEKENLQKQHQALKNKQRDYEEMQQKRLIELTDEIENITSQGINEVEEYEDRLIDAQRQLKVREKTINELIADIEQIKMIHQNENAAHESGASELLSKIHSLKCKLADSEARDEGNSAMFVAMEEKIVNLDGQNTELIHQNQMLSDQLIKKEKQCIIKTQNFEDISIELDSLKKVKADLFSQLLTLKESFTVERETLKHTSSDLKEEENKNTQLKIFNAEILKDKQILIKKEAELQQKVNGQEEKVQMLMIDIAEKNQELTKRESMIKQFREQSKGLHIQKSNSQGVVSDLKLEIQRQREKVKDRERKVLQKDEEFNFLSAQSKKTIAKFETQLSHLKQENETLNETLRKEQSVSASKVSDFELEVKKLKQSEKSLSQANIVLQEQIFFQKQMHSLATGKTDQLHQQISNLHIEIDRMSDAINQLNDQLKQKEEALFALSGKLYNSDNRLESKEQELKQRLEKFDLEWRYKVQEICEEYQNKLQLLQREKSYVRTDMEGYSQVVQKLQNEKSNLRHELERQRQNWQGKLKKAEEEKLLSLIDKNKQIQKLREVFQELEQKLKRRDFQIKNLEEDKKKAEEKIRQFKTEAQKSDENHIQALRNLQRDIDQYKRKQGQLKRFKQALKNNQWAIEREIKKGVQNCAKNVVNLSQQENKEEVMNLMRNLQAAVGRMACPNIDDL